MAKRGRPLKGFGPPDTDLPELLDLWNRALAAPHGIAIESAHPARLAAKLYEARRECGHAAYAELRIVQLENEVQVKPR